MNKEVTLTLSQGKFDGDFYRVKSATNTVEWQMGQKLTKKEVRDILSNPNYPVKVVIKLR